MLKDTPSHDFPMNQGHIVPSHKVCGEAFHGRWGTNCFRQVYSKTVLHGELMI